MKKLKLSMVALAVAIAGSLSAKAVDTLYWLEVEFTNTTATIWEVWGIPQTTSGFPAIENWSINADTDGSGKVSGYGVVGIEENTNGVPWSYIPVEVKGKMSKKGSAATSTLTIKGKGYRADGAGGGEAVSLNLKFTGQPGVNPLNTNQTRIVGKLTGNWKAGKTNTKIDRSAVITQSDKWQLDVEGDVLQNAKKMQLFDRDLTGTGSIKKNNTYSLKVKGTGWNKGSSATLTGNLGAYTNNVVIGTNLTAVVFQAPVTADLKGKVQGQTVTDQGNAKRDSNSIWAGLIW